MCKQNNCGCGTKGGIKPTLKYCGAELPCTGIVKGDDYTTVLQKIDAVACSGGGEVGNYTFSESTTCPNGGLIVSRDGVQIFEQCYECCGTSEQKLVAYDEFRSNLQFEESSTIQNSSSNPAYKTQITHTITSADGAGIYELYFSGMFLWRDGINTNLGVYVNNLVEDGIYTTWLKTDNIGAMDIVTPIHVFKSNMALNVGDIVGIGGYNGSGTLAPTVDIEHCKWKLTKIG